MPFVVGETIGPYRILEQLGRGGMATVFKAYHAALDRYVAIKALHPAFMEDPNFLARFQREARVVAKLEHPNIVPIYDFAEYEDRPYLVMKYIEGETLKARLNQGIIEQTELIQIVEAIGTGLFYAHQQGILHRDVKPSNVLLGFDNRVYLADFGLARIAQAGESTLSSDMMLGTPQYISPEQAMGLGDLDERTDIYSFGVMLYEMAVGQVPFSADTPFSIIHDHIYTPLPLPRLVNANVPETTERVLLKALAKERDDRYLDAVALANAFTQAVSVDFAVTSVAVPPPAPNATYIPEPEIPASTPPPETTNAKLEPSHPVETLAPQNVVSGPQLKPRRRFRWWYIPIGIILIIICCFCGIITYNSLGRGADNEIPSAEQLPGGPPPEPFQEQQSPPQGLDAPPLGDAQNQVGESPEDPDAWLDLALAYWSNGQPEEASGALNQALEFAGDSPDFYFNTASSLANMELWVASAHVYLRGIQRFHPGQVPPDLIDEFHEAAFWAAEYPEAARDIPLPAIAEVDVPMERVAQARHQFHSGHEGEAMGMIEEVLTQIEPGMPEALYLQSEIFYAWGDVQASFNNLFELQERDDTPEWIRDDIELILYDAILMRERAQEQVDADPENPFVYLPLYEAYLGVGLYNEAEDVLQQALSVAGADPIFALTAGEVAARNEAWLDAAQLYVVAGKLKPGTLSPELSEKIVEALYHGALEEGAPEVFGEMEMYLPEDGRGILRNAYRDALIARYKLHYENSDEAKALIEDVVGRTPNLALPRLIQAEIYLFADDIPQSEAILLELQGSRTASPWVLKETQFMLEQIKP